MDNDIALDERIRNLVKKIAGFPHPGINFIDITPILEQEPGIFRSTIERLCTPHRANPPDTVLCIEAMGFVFGTPIAYELGSKLVLARRSGKLPRPTLQLTYDMGYDRNRQMHIHAGAIEPGSRVLIVDDFLANGGTVLAAADLVGRAGARVASVSVAFELERFKARERIEQRGIPLYAAVRL